MVGSLVGSYDRLMEEARMKDLIHLVIGTVGLFMIFSPFPSFAQVIQPIDHLSVFDANGT